MSRGIDSPGRRAAVSEGLMFLFLAWDVMISQLGVRPVFEVSDVSGRMALFPKNHGVATC